MTIAGELFERAHAYLRGNIGLEELDMWTAENAPRLAELNETDPMAHLLGVIHVTLAEIDDAAAQEADLLARLADYFSSYAERFRTSPSFGQIDAGEVGSENEAVELSSSSSVEVGTPRTAEHIAA